MVHFFRKAYVCLPDTSRCCLIYSFKQVVRNSLATFSHLEIGMLIFVSLCFNQCHFYSNHTFNIYANRDARFQWNYTKSPTGSTLGACFLPNLYIQLVALRYMLCYYLATLFVLSLDSNPSGLHVNLAGWTYIGGAGQDSMIGCSILVVSISPLPSL